MTLKRLAKITLALVLIPLIASVLAYIASPGIIQSLTGPYLESLGASNVSINIKQPGLEGVFIKRFKAQWQGFDISLQNVQVSYTMSGLLNGQIEALSLKQATLTAIPDTQASTQAEDKTFSKIEVPAALFTWSELLPDSSPGLIEISEFLIQNSDNKISGELSYSANSLSIQGYVQNQWLNTGHSYALSIDQSRNLELSLFQKKSQPELQLRIRSGKPTQDSMRLTGELYAGAAIVSELLLPYLQDLGIQGFNGKLELKFQLQAPRQKTGSIVVEDMQFSASITPDLSLSLLIPNYEDYPVLVNWNKPGSVTVSPRQAHVSSGPHISVSGPDMQAELDIETLHAELIDFTHLSSTVVSIIPGAKLKLLNIVDDTESEFSLSNINISTQTLLSISINQDTQTFGVKAAILDLEIPHLTYLRTPYSLKTVIIETPDIYQRWNENPNLTVKLRNTSNTLSASILIKSEDNAFSTNTHLKLVSQDSFFKELFSSWKHDFDANGSLTFNLNASLNIEMLDFSSFSGALVLENANLFYGDLSANGVDLNAPFQLKSQLKDQLLVTDWMRAKIDRADAGVVLTDIEANLRYSPSTLDIGVFKMHLLGGEAHSEALSYTFGSASAQTKISFSNLQLPLLVALADDEIQASGVIDGSLKLNGLFAENNSIDLVIEEGSINARPPGGLIQYRIDNNSLDLARQSDFVFALTALENFNYQQLNSSITLNKDGELKLGVSLLGNNPKVKDGRQIQYNLNINQNLFTLLRSLQLSNSLSNRIGEKLAE